MQDTHVHFVKMQCLMLRLKRSCRFCITRKFTLKADDADASWFILGVIDLLLSDTEADPEFLLHFGLGSTAAFPRSSLTPSCVPHIYTDRQLHVSMHPCVF